MSKDEDPILVEEDEAIATILLNRPQRLNAMNLAMWERLGTVLTELNAREDLRCLVLRGAGTSAFGAGADIAEFPELRYDSAQAAAYAERMEPALQGLGESPIPSLAMIMGPCVGGGLELALLCDLRIAGEGARFGIPINRIGHTLPYPGLRALIELVGRSTAMEILLEGCVLSAEEALTRGLVNRVVADDQVEAEAMAAASRIAKGAPLAARRHKVMARRIAKGEILDAKAIAEAFECCDSEDYREGIAAFLEKRRPAFRGR